jgi:hypothetical protein
MGVGTTFAVIAGALLVGWLLNAEPISQTAAAQPAGWQRSVAVAASEIVAGVSDALLLDEPHDAIVDALDRDPSAGDQPVVPGDVFVPTEDRPALLWVTGDSLAETIGAAVVNESAATGVIEPRFDVEYSSGLARPELYDWPAQAAAILAAEPADIVVFTVGANDGQAMEAGGEFVAFGEERWLTEYSIRVGDMMDVLRVRSATVYWLGLPVAADTGRSLRFSTMNEIYRSQAATRSDVHYVDIYSAFSGPDGAYEPLLPDATGRLVRARDPDGIHFTPEGAELVAHRVLDAIGEVWELAR